MTQEELMQVFTEATYNILNSGIYIRLNQLNEELDDILEDYGVKEWVLITAWNPGGSRRPTNANQNQQIELLKDLEDYKLLDTRGQSLDKSWFEDGYLVLGLTKSNGIELAKKYGQKAILFGTSGKPAELIWIE